MGQPLGPLGPVQQLLQTAAQKLVTHALQTPLFTEEGNYAAAYRHNAAFAKTGPWTTPLTPQQRAAFSAWVKKYNVPVTPDYDMQGYFLSSGGAPHTAGAHFPDTFKTPYDTTFSGESKYAKPGTPFVWRGNRLVDARSGQVIFAPPSK